MVGTGDEEHIITRVIPGTDPLQDFEEDDPSQLIVIDDDTDDSSDADDLSEVFHGFRRAASASKSFQALLSDVCSTAPADGGFRWTPWPSRVEDMSVGAG